MEGVAGPLLRYANSVGGDAAKLGARGALLDGELRSGQAQASAPVWFVFTGAQAHAAMPSLAFISTIFIALC